MPNGVQVPCAWYRRRIFQGCALHGLEDFFSMLQEIGRHIVMGHVLTAGGFAKRIEFLDLKTGQFDSEKTKKF